MVDIITNGNRIYHSGKPQTYHRNNDNCWWKSRL